MIPMTTPDEIDALMNVDSLSRIPERIVPGRTDRAETAEHMARYRFAATRALGRTLDLGSGVGYGASIIAAAQSVNFMVALDNTSRALAFGKGSYGETISFVTGDAGALPFSKDSLDSVVCLEVIEHVPDAEILLREIARVLRPDGLLIVSTPNKWATSPLQRRPINPYHVVEWYPNGFKKLVSRYFEVEEVLGQSWHSVGMTWQALRSNARTRLKGILGRLRLLGVAQQLRKASRHDSIAEEASQQGSVHRDAPTEEEVLAASPRSWTNTRQEGIPLTVILIARWSKAHVSQRSGWDSHQE
jgi:2-polyprenyl-3-methyl-5-hydroxy-6-metoxy-1,4-benzoquinol methylase